jgi:peptide/nickel transport system substrate-binding protein
MGGRQNMAQNYWDKSRSSRRRFLGVAGAAGAGAAGLALVGCGDDDDDNGGATTPGTTPATGTTPDQPKDQPKVGGTFRAPLVGTNSGDPPTLFPFENLTYLAQVPSTNHYSRLMRGVSGPDISPTDHTKLEGDIAEKYEQPDDQTYVFTLKPNIKWHDKAPLNGRTATATDFVKTYEAFLATSQNAAGWKAVVDKVEAPDEKTVRISLKTPFAPFLTTHASSAEAVWFIPAETIDSGLAKRDPIGTGPYVFRQYEPGVAMRWDRHPNYHDSPIPYYERVESSMLRDPQRIIAGLQAGDFDLSHFDGTFYTEASQKLDKNGSFQFEQTAVLGAVFFNFDIKPWQDKRMRQAISLAMDRVGIEKIMDATGQGDWHSHISPALAPFYVSPKTNEAEFGPNAKYFKRNIAEAKALMSAAGYPNGIKFKLVANVDRYGASAQQNWELIAATIKEAGFEPELTFQEYGAYIQSTYLGRIPEGSIAVGPLIGAPRDPDNIFFTNFISTSARKNWGGTPIPEQADLDDRFQKQRTIMDLEQRKQAIKEIQQIMAEAMPVVPYTAGALFKYAQPWVKNFYSKGGYALVAESLMKTYFTDERIRKG